MKITNEMGKEIKEFYKRGESLRGISKKFELDRGTIKRFLINNNVKIKNNFYRKRKYTLNEHAFDEITPESAYWIGFLMADGYVENSLVTIGLKHNDYEHIKKFLEFVNGNNPIMIKDRVGGFGGSLSRLAVVRVFSKLMVDKLSEYGVTPRKSLTAKVCDELAFNRDFWRGVIDGDGSIGEFKRKECKNHKLFMNLVGSKYIVNQFSDYIKIIFDRSGIVNTPPKAMPAKKGLILNLQNGRALVVMKSLYENSEIFLDRKKELYYYLTEKYKNVRFNRGSLINVKNIKDI